METPDDIDRLIQEVLSELGADADPAAVARQVRKLDRGLPAEDEFSVLCAWLGRCELIHKLDQLQAPAASHAAYQVPDLLAVFEGTGPVLIEVKAKAKQTLSFRPDYLGRLQAYADRLRMPLLIAWKHHGHWTLFEARHLKLARVNSYIRLGEALRQNLLGLLAGDVGFKLSPGAGIHFEIAKEKLLSRTEEASRVVEEWRMRITQVRFTKGGGADAGALHPETQQLLSIWDLDDAEHHEDARIIKSFTAGEDGMQFAHMALVRLLAWERKDGPARWRPLLRSPQITRSITRFHPALDRALEEGVVSHILHQRPVEAPLFSISSQGRH